MEVGTTADGVTVVNDAYNANPDSMRAALRTLAAMRTTGRTFAVLGEMAELGADSIAEHDAIGPARGAAVGVADHRRRRGRPCRCTSARPRRGPGTARPSGFPMRLRPSRCSREQLRAW